MPHFEKSSVSFEPKNVKELSVFFSSNKDQFHEIWIILTKKKCVNPQPVSFAQAVDEAIAQGLVDSQTKGLDEHRYAIRFTLRKVAKGYSSEG